MSGTSSGFNAAILICVVLGLGGLVIIAANAPDDHAIRAEPIQHSHERFERELAKLRHYPNTISGRTAKARKLRMIKAQHERFVAQLKRDGELDDYDEDLIRETRKEMSWLSYSN